MKKIRTIAGQRLHTTYQGKLSASRGRQNLPDDEGRIFPHHLPRHIHLRQI
ncbi:hypothetical protein CCANI_11585 [Corynebacterium canis]|nr:hypothetical protein CCANI_11585 [Corynebacterium canis]